MSKVPARALFQRAPIRRQLMLLLAVLSLASVAFGFVLVMIDDIAAYEEYEGKLGSYLARLTADFSYASVLFADKKGVLERLSFLETIPGVNSATVKVGDETTFARWERGLSRPGLTAVPPSSGWLDRSETFNAAIMHDGERIGEVVLEVSYEAFRDAVGEHFVRMMWILMVVLAVALVFAYALQRPISTPITRLATATETLVLGKGRQVPVPMHAAREIAELYRGFNNMLLRIDERERERDAIQQELSRAHADLEERVAQRTLELEKANEELMLEIRERSAVEKQLTRTLRERDVLLREIHHRVKNNLNVVYGLLALQARRLEDAVAIAALADSRQRVKVMATVHETIYESTSVSHVYADQFVKRLVSDLQEACAIDPALIRMETSLDCFILDLEQAIPVGLILSELVTNAFKHAFPDSREGVVEVHVGLTEGDTIELCVSDDGIGMAPCCDGDKSRTLGLQLVEALCQQLDGRVEFDSDRGTRARVTFIHRID